MNGPITKEIIWTQLHSTSDNITKEFDLLYKDELENLIEEMAISYEILNAIINREDQSKTSDADFQSALLYWTALNTYLAAVELFRLGYNKEPQMLLRNVLETFSAAYDIHVNPEKLKILQEGKKHFDSKHSIKVAKKINPMIAKMWGQLSNYFSHVSTLHILPHKTAPLCIGGLFDPEYQIVSVCGILPPLDLTLSILNSTLELTFIKHIPTSRFWRKTSENIYQFSLPKSHLGHGKKLIEKMSKYIKK